MLKNLVRRLHDKHPGAAASLEEGLDETLSRRSTEGFAGRGT